MKIKRFALYQRLLKLLVTRYGEDQCFIHICAKLGFTIRFLCTNYNDISWNSSETIV